jgi:type II secretory ATPase GspE/PulE/Tfp pilus assembly ATPase PilB-like protein
LSLPDEVRARLGELLRQTSGAILITGPAGSGKTTTAYACVREVLEGAAPRSPHVTLGARCVVTIEDPIEVAIDGAAQSQVNAAAGFDLAQGLRSILRQDPEVVLVGEIRDRETAEGTFGAALTGHLVLTTFHATSAAGAVSRLAEMGIEPYLLRSGVLAIVHQRLVRRLCECAEWSAEDADRCGYGVARARRATGCERCGGTGYRGRVVLAEMLEPTATQLGRAILDRDDAARIEALAIEAGLVPIAERARAALESGTTSAAELRRVLGTRGT